MLLGVRHWNVDDSDSKPADFDHRFWSDSKSNNEFESTITISIKFRSNFDYSGSMLIFFAIKIDRFGSIFDKNIEKDKFKFNYEI